MGVEMANRASFRAWRGAVPLGAVRVYEVTLMSGFFFFFLLVPFAAAAAAAGFASAFSSFFASSTLFFSSLAMMVWALACCSACSSLVSLPGASMTTVEPWMNSSGTPGKCRTNLRIGSSCAPINKRSGLPFAIRPRMQSKGRTEHKRRQMRKHRTARRVFPHSTLLGDDSEFSADCLCNVAVWIADRILCRVCT